MPDIKLGAVDRSVLVFLPDPASTDGSGKTGLVAANLTVSYTRVETDNDVVVTDVTSSLSNLSALTDAHADWGLKEVSSTLAPGLYRLDIADAVFASGAWYAVVYVMITTSAAAASPILFTLIAFDPNGYPEVNVTQWLGTAPSTPTVAGVPNVNAKTWNDLTTVALPLVPTTAGRTLDVTAANKVNGVVLVDTLTTYTGNTPQTGDVFPLASTEIADIKAKTDNLPSDPADESLIIAATDAIMTRLGVAGAGLTALGDARIANLDATVSSRATPAQVNTEADTALSDAGVTPTRTGYLDNLSAGAVALQSSLSALITTVGVAGAGLTATATAVWAVGTRLLTAGTNIVLAKGTGVTGFNDITAADVWAAGTRTLTSFGTLVADVATAVWGAGIRTLSAFDASFKTGYALSSAGVQAIWDALTSALTTVGSIGKHIVDNLNATVGSRASQTSVDDLPTNAELATAVAAADDAVLAAIAALNNLSQANVRTALGLASANLDTQLDALPTNAELATALGTADDAILAAILALNNLSQANVRTAIGLASANLDTQLDALPTAAELGAQVTSDHGAGSYIRNTEPLSAAQVNAEVVDALNVDTYAEPGQGAPAATASLVTKLGNLHKAWRNRHTQTSTEYKLYGDDASTVDQKATTSDDGTTFERTEIASGP